MTNSPPIPPPDTDIDLGPLHWAPPGPPAPVARKRRRWLAPFLVTIAVLVVIGILAASFITLPYYAIAPGSARQVDDLVRVSDATKVYSHKGGVLFTTVSLYRARPLDAVQSWWNDNIELVPEKRILGTAKPDQLNQINLQEMTDSKQLAVAVALRRIGVKEEGSGTVVTSLGQNVAASGHLQAGDVILSIDGKPTMLSQDAVDAVRARKPGEVGVLVVRGPGSEANRTESITFGEHPQSPGVAYLGVALSTKDSHFDIPYTVSIDSGSVGGPSAGLSFTLELIDSLTPGELTGGRKVAVTGTIGPDGTVGPVGGVLQKTAAVRSAGARYFLVPPDEYATAKAHAGKNLQVVKVETLEQALTFLQSIGGDIAALGPAPAGLRR